MLFNVAAKICGLGSNAPTRTATNTYGRRLSASFVNRFSSYPRKMSSSVDIGDKSVVVAGAGLAGGLLACYLRKRGLNVHVVERRPDPRSHVVDGGRSINLALSERGINALKGIGLLEDILSITIPMYGRYIHAVGPSLYFQTISSIFHLFVTHSDALLTLNIVFSDLDKFRFCLEVCVRYFYLN